MTEWDTVIVVDWSSGNDRGPTPKPDAIWSATVGPEGAEPPVYHRNRQVAETWLTDRLAKEMASGRRILIGFDFPFGFPAGFAETVTGSAAPEHLWDWFAEHLSDTPKANNRFALAGRLNRLFPGVGPFWFNGGRDDVPDLPRKGTAREGHGMSERRRADMLAKGAFPVWQMGGAGAVGGQAITGMALLSRLRATYPDTLAVWPFEPLDAPIGVIEVWPSLIARRIAEEADTVKDRAQVRCLAAAIAALPTDVLSHMLRVDDPDALREEGWIFGLGHEDALAAAVPRGTLAPPPLKDDCFSLPPGVDWTPVDDALARLRERLHPVVGTERVESRAAVGRILAADAIAARSNPPAPNSAVDGYGFAHTATGEGAITLPLVPGRAAAGAPFSGAVPKGGAVRILTGALLPDGVDTVVLEEDTTTDGTHVAFRGPVKPGANTRRAGEDVAEGAVALRRGMRIGPPEIALLSALGVTEAVVYRPLRVGVLSTGDEIAEPGVTRDAATTYDANRPMLLSLFADWRFDAVDLGHIGDDRTALKDRLDHAATRCDAIFTSGGASQGDEDHMSALLGETGSRADWRIALKPGRPLALGVWQGVPVFGLPGNPVAALVCTMIFGRPALGLLAGEGWREPAGFTVPAAFSKTKKPGRREYLRARLTSDGHAEVFRSEGSGRISGLAWADGLVEIGDAAQTITPGDPVRYIPYSSLR